VTILRIILASLHVSRSRLLSWNAKQMTCCTRATMLSLHIRDAATQGRHRKSCLPGHHMTPKCVKPPSD